MHQCLEVLELVDTISQYCDKQTLVNFARCNKSLSTRVLAALYTYSEVPLSGILSHAPGDAFAKRHEPHRLKLNRPLKNESDWQRIASVAKHVRTLRVSWDGFNIHTFNKITKWSGYPTPLFPKLSTLLWQYNFSPSGAANMFQMLLNPGLNLLILGGRPYERWSRCRVSPHLNQNESAALLAVAGTISDSLPSLELTTHLDGSSLSHFRQLHSLTVDIDFFMTPAAISSIASLPSLRTLHLKSPWAWEQKGSLPSPPYAQGGFPALQFVNVTNTANLREAIPWCQLTSVTVDGRDEPDYTSTVQYQSIFSLLMKMTNARSLAPASLRQLRLWPCYYSRNSKIRLDPTDNILLFTHLTTLDIVFLGAGWGLDFKDEDILRIVTALTALEHLTLQSPMINQPFVTEHNDAPPMPTPRALLYIAEYCLSIRSVDLFMTFTSQFPAATSSNHSLREIAFGRSSIPSATSAASFLQALFPKLKIFNVTALDNPDIHSASHPGAAIEALELKNALENAQEMARLCGIEWAVENE